MNQATSYMDGSQIYGVDVDEQLKLRAGVGGKEQNSRLWKINRVQSKPCVYWLQSIFEFFGIKSIIK